MLIVPEVKKKKKQRIREGKGLLIIIMVLFFKRTFVSVAGEAESTLY